MKTLILCFGLLIGISFVSNAQSTSTLKVSFQDIENDEGMLRIGLYSSSGDWLEKVFKSKSSTIVGGKCDVVFENIPFGEYAISAYHDENDNGKMDKYLGFYPKESYACSNQAPANYGPPEWRDAKFKINKKKNQQHIKF